MKMQNLYPECTCGQDHHFFICKCGSEAFKLNASKKLICDQCNSVFDLNKVLSMIKKNTH